MQRPLSIIEMRLHFPQQLEECVRHFQSTDFNAHIYYIIAVPVVNRPQVRPVPNVKYGIGARKGRLRKEFKETAGKFSFTTEQQQFILSKINHR